MRVAILSTYPPRRCGLATFTADLRIALLEADHSVEVVVVGVLDEPGLDQPEVAEASDEDVPPEVVLSLRQHDRADYARTAEAINDAGVDVVLVQHEYGIFGGEAGEYLLDLLRALTVPYVVTLHTLLLDPNPQQRAVLGAVVEGAAEVTVFTALARDQLVRSGLAPWGRVSVLNHGAPEHLQSARVRPGAHVPPAVDASPSIPELAGHDDRRVISTFGLLSPGKGIDMALRALRRVADEHPDALYVVAGRSHPGVVRHEGERYRTRLRELTAELGLDEHVLFLDRYLADEDIRDLLLRTEVFLTPYRHPEQVVSGVLTFALVAGCPVVSTPYFYATELLTTGAGRLVGFDDHEAMADAVVDLLTDHDLRARTAETAYRVGSQYTWPRVGRDALKLLSTTAHAGVSTGQLATSGGPGPSPPLDHLHRLVGPGGIVQHATHGEPDHATGSCIDDIARLAIVADGLLRRGGPERERPALQQMVTLGLDHIEDAWDGERAAMRNLRDLDGRWLDEPHTGDHLGRAIWALAQVGSGTGAAAERSREVLRRVLAAEPTLPAPRSAALAVIGLARLPGHELGSAGRRSLTHLSAGLASLLTTNATSQWLWFEDELTYDNARLAQALVSAGAAQRDATQLRLGLEALDWYCGQCRVDSGTVVLVGNRWRRRPPRSPRVSRRTGVSRRTRVTSSRWTPPPWSRRASRPTAPPAHRCTPSAPEPPTRGSTATTGGGCRSTTR